MQQRDDVVSHTLGDPKPVSTRMFRRGQRTPSPPSTAHHYFLRCRDYSQEQDGSLTGRTTGCVEAVLPEAYYGNVSMAQNCGSSLMNTFEVVQTSILDKGCLDGFSTSLMVTFNGADVAQDSGCWTSLRGKAYQLGAEFVCVSNIRGPSDTCAQWLSLDSTNGTAHERSLPLWLLVVFLVLSCDPKDSNNFSREPVLIPSSKGRLKRVFLYKQLERPITSTNLFLTHFFPAKIREFRQKM